MKKYFVALVLLTLVTAVTATAYTALTRLSGEITSIDADAKTLVVGDVTVYTTETTQVLNCGEPATFDDLKVGQTVRVVGEEIDGKFVAKKICIKAVCDGTGPNGKCRRGPCPQ